MSIYGTWLTPIQTKTYAHLHRSIITLSPCAMANPPHQSSQDLPAPPTQSFFDFLDMVPNPVIGSDVRDLSIPSWHFNDFGASPQSQTPHGPPSALGSPTPILVSDAVLSCSGVAQPLLRDMRSHDPPDIHASKSPHSLPENPVHVSSHIPKCSQIAKKLHRDTKCHMGIFPVLPRWVLSQLHCDIKLIHSSSFTKSSMHIISAADDPASTQHSPTPSVEEIVPEDHGEPDNMTFEERVERLHAILDEEIEYLEDLRDSLCRTTDHVLLGIHYLAHLRNYVLSDH